MLTEPAVRRRIWRLESGLVLELRVQYRPEDEEYVTRVGVYPVRKRHGFEQRVQEGSWRIVGYHSGTRLRGERMARLVDQQVDEVESGALDFVVQELVEENGATT
jgi:hypothetical protein